MKHSFYIKICGMILCAILLLGALCVCISAEQIKNYTVTMDGPVGQTTSNMPIVIRGYEQGTNPVLHLSGWIKTDQTICRYEYTLDGGKTWKRNSIAVASRPDTKPYNPKTYETAGYDLKIDVSKLSRGTYDLFVRAITDQEDFIDVIAMIDIKIGHVDHISMTYRELNLYAYGATDGVLTLHAGESLALDAYNLRQYQSFEVITDNPTVLTLHTDPADTLQFSASSAESVHNEDGTYTTVIALHTPQFAGKLMLTSTETVHVTRMRFYTTTPNYYDGELEIHMTVTPNDYLGSANAVESTVMSDETVGTYVRLNAATNTGDPYIYFSLGNYLKDTKDGMLINADHYRYAVMTLQTPSTNSRGPFRLFLCAGEVRGPTGGVDVHFQPVNDGEWHRYVIPLCDQEMWSGTVYGMRFDFIDAHALSTDYANIASISFHPDKKSAEEAAAQPFSIYHESGKEPTNLYKEEGRAPSGRADRITYFDESLSDCFSGANKSIYSFDEYGHLILQSLETFNDPFVSFSLEKYSEITGLPLLRAEEYGIIVLRILADKKIDGKGFTLYYYSGGYDYAQGERAVNTPYEGGNWEYLIYDMKDRNAWTDEILGMRLDYAQYISAGQRVCVSDILFFENIEAWETYARENGIPIEGDESVEIQTRPATPETEMPTIEIPTQGPGLQEIPNEQQHTDCKSISSAPALIFVSLCTVALIYLKKKKGEIL